VTHEAAYGRLVSRPSGRDVIDVAGDDSRESLCREEKAMSWQQAKQTAGYRV